MFRNIALLLLLFINRETAAQSLPFIMDMVYNNPGEAPFVTKYNNPDYLKSAGFNAMVPKWYVSCAITYDNVQKNIVPLNSPERRWIDSTATVIERKLAEYKKAGINVYPFTDLIVFPNSIWEKYGDSISTKGDARKPDINRPMTQQLLRAQIAGIFDRFPQLDGIVLRFGETYLHDTPFHKGGSPIGNGKQGIQDHITFINILRDEICVKRNKKLFYRTWDFGYNFHNNPDYYLAVTNAIAPHPNLIFSIKYQQGDFLRMTPFNPTLGIGKHKQIVESESAMEVYGKGAHPYYAAYGVINGWPETKYEIVDARFTGKLNNPSNPRGIKDILNKGLLCGVYTWSRGGGWTGPYITSEIWTDLNTYVVSHWGMNTSRSEEKIFYEFAALHGMTGIQADRFRQIAMLSIEAVRKGQCNSYANNQVWWSRDQFFSVSVNKDVISDILKENVADKVLAEKAEATGMWKQIEDISKNITIPGGDSTVEAIRVSCTYGRIKYALCEQMWIMMLEYAKPNPDKNILAPAVQKYDQLWAEWRALKTSSKYCATLYTDMGFLNERGGSIGEMVDAIRKVIR
ncbi:hypothetical protein SAMN05428988_3975 [Chitinophaga sp. YR573]|uniref:hypothetical protein n=1 Tax=Chitinophaga sp. YR573 TaxID=1881040 RepID=UPI0008ACCD34|nr:hypothetical protein [Chitinophaga sp. YR573]SEW28649.1 hypothetical protein SAMN05428988_3975 [Chitinophaga sp. YR573]